MRRGAAPRCDTRRDRPSKGTKAVPQEAMVVVAPIRVAAVLDTAWLPHRGHLRTKDRRSLGTVTSRPCRRYVDKSSVHLSPWRDTCTRARQRSVSDVTRPPTVTDYGHPVAGPPSMRVGGDEVPPASAPPTRPYATVAAPHCSNARARHCRRASTRAVMAAQSEGRRVGSGRMSQAR